MNVTTVQSVSALSATSSTNADADRDTAQQANEFASAGVWQDSEVMALLVQLLQLLLDALDDDALSTDEALRSDVEDAVAEAEEVVESLQADAIPDAAQDSDVATEAAQAGLVGETVSDGSESDDTVTSYRPQLPFGRSNAGNWQLLTWMLELSIAIMSQANAADDSTGSSGA